MKRSCIYNSVQLFDAQNYADGIRYILV
uniref:Uncharacterized protein n=1 Tax=Arundo donax TaxID=35708 RepID=A0A0A8YCI0_ARUDO